MREHTVFEEIGSLNEINDLRNQYFDNLAKAQELYLELMIGNSRVYVIKSRDQRAGYFLLGDSTTLLEYYVTQDHLDQADILLGRIIQKFSIQRVLCKSFDHTLLSCCAGFQKRVNVLGILFREQVEKEAARPMTEVITVRLANAMDEQLIIRINEEIFEHDEEVSDYIRKEQIFLFENGGEFIGFGIFARVIEGRPEFDIGMLVDRKYRRRGYGEFIIRYLANHCRQNGWYPICGCAIENVGSRRCLENAGFISRYRLLEFVI